MKPEKMTDKELEQKRKDMEAGMAWIPVDEFAHIAALTAERDAHEQRADIHSETIREFRAEQEQDVVTINALRERVQALEAEATRLQRNTREAQQYASETVQERITAESRLAAIRQRAGEFTLPPGSCHATDAVRYVVGDDAPESGQCANQRPRSTESERHLAQVVRSTEATMRALPAAPEVCAEPSTVEGAHKPGTNSARMPGEDDVMLERAGDAPTTELTTAEAFTWVRTTLDACRIFINGPEGARTHDLHDREIPATLTNLSLLERRMGVMTRAAQAVLATQGRNTREAITAWNDLRAALTDAPPVFTLEEVVESLVRAGADVEAIKSERERLSAVRR